MRRQGSEEKRVRKGGEGEEGKAGEAGRRGEGAAGEVVGSVRGLYGTGRSLPCVVRSPE